MKLVYATLFNARDVNQWSGTPYYMSRAFQDATVELEFIGSLAKKIPRKKKIIQIIKRIGLKEKESQRFNLDLAKNYSDQIATQIANLQFDAVLATQVNPVAYLNCKQPIILWTDALFAGQLGFHPPSASISKVSIEQANKVTANCLARCRLALFSSDWAARSALELYGVEKDKVKVVPFGANLESSLTSDEIREIVKKRTCVNIKLLFIGVHWERKGGPIVLEVAKMLHALGHPVELNIVGCYPSKKEIIPPYVKCHGFISKSTPLGCAQIKQLFTEAHFLFVPSQAEAFGIVFCEANSYGVPCITTSIGGIPTIVKDNLNGKTFSLQADSKSYCEYIIHTVQDSYQYEKLALSSFNEYETRLNWRVAVNQAKKLIQEVL